MSLDRRFARTLPLYDDAIELGAGIGAKLANGVGGTDEQRRSMMILGAGGVLSMTLFLFSWKLTAVGVLLGTLAVGALIEGSPSKEA